MADVTVSLGIDSSKAGVSVRDLTKDLRGTEDAAGDAGKQIDLLDAKVDELGESAERAKPAIDNQGRAIEESGRKARETDRDLERLTDSVEENTRETNENRRAIDKQGDELDDNSGDLDRNTRATDRNTGARRRNSRASKEAGQEADTLGGRMLLLGGNLSRAAGITAGLAGGTYAAGRAFGAVIGPAMQFEDAMLAVQATTNATAEEFELLEKAAMSAGRGLARGPTDAAQAQLFLARAGLNPQQIAQALRQSLELAVAGGLGAGFTADALTNIAGAFGFGVDDFGRVSDVLAFVETTANTDIAGVAQAMSKVGALAAEAGWDIEEMATAVGVLADSGIEANISGRMLRGAISRLLNLTPDAAKALDELGISAEDINPTMNSLSDIIGILNENGADLQDIFRLVGVEPANVIIKLMADHKTLVERSADIRENWEGTTTRIAETKTSGLKSAFKELADETDRMFTNISETFALMEGTKFVVEGATGIAGGMNFVLSLDDIVKDAFGVDATDPAAVDTRNRRRELTKVNRQLETEQAKLDALRSDLPRVEALAESGLGRHARILSGRLKAIEESQETVNDLLAKQEELSGRIAENEKTIVANREKRAAATAEEVEEVVEDEELVLPPVEAVVKDIGKLYESLGTTADEFTMMLESNFTNLFGRVLDGQEEFGDIFDSTMKNIFNTVLTNLWAEHVSSPLAAGIKSGIETLFGFSGGGYTGNAPRSGGIDGKGGFLAVMHPKEMVTDLTKPQSMGSTNVTINQTMDFRNADQSTVARLQEAMPIIADAAANKVKQELAQGGDFYQFASGA